MLRYLLIAWLFLVVVSGSAFAENKSFGDNKATRAGGLVCVSMDGQHGQSCDALCAKPEMVCTGTAAKISPPLACSDLISDTVPPFPVCRCCAVGH